MRELCDWCEETQKEVEVLNNTCHNWYEEYHKLRIKKERLQNIVKDFLEYIKNEELIDYFKEMKDLEIANKIDDFVNNLESQV